ncbi:hypothetical protein GTV15_08745 [Streptomyces sp. SID7803]|nr:hypothetical protein [Streptomyces sp. SID7803]
MVERLLPSTGAYTPPAPGETGGTEKGEVDGPSAPARELLIFPSCAIRRNWPRSSTCASSIRRTSTGGAVSRPPASITGCTAI